jgi:hypothetical protein
MYKMRDALQKQGVLVETHEAKWLGHITTYLFSEESIVLGVQFAKRVLAQKSSSIKFPATEISSEK